MFLDQETIVTILNRLHQEKNEGEDITLDEVHNYYAANQREIDECVSEIMRLKQTLILESIQTHLKAIADLLGIELGD